MAELQFIGEVAAPAGATVTAVVRYLSDYRDESGRVPSPAYRFKRLPGQGWQAEGGGPAVLLGPSAPGLPVPSVQVSYTVLLPGGIPQVCTLTRRILPNTEAPGFWDFTRPDTQQPSWTGGSGQPTPLEVLPGAGPQGEPGVGWLSGSGAPQAAGRAGEHYLDTLSGDVYRHEGGAWLPVYSLRGLPGAPGPRGPQGESWPAPVASQAGAVLQATSGGATWVPLAELGQLDRDTVAANLRLTHGVPEAFEQDVTLEMPVPAGVSKLELLVQFGKSTAESFELYTGEVEVSPPWQAPQTFAVAGSRLLTYTPDPEMPDVMPGVWRVRLGHRGNQGEAMLQFVLTGESPPPLLFVPEEVPPDEPPPAEPWPPPPDPNWPVADQVVRLGSFVPSENGRPYTAWAISYDARAQQVLAYDFAVPIPGDAGDVNELEIQWAAGQLAAYQLYGPAGLMAEITAGDSVGVTSMSISVVPSGAYRLYVTPTVDSRIDFSATYR